MTVYFVGAGPGDPELLTRKAWRILGESDVIFYDALLDIDGMRAAAPSASWIHVGKRAGRVSTAQDFISKSIVGHAKRGQRVTRLKGGDPSLFGRLTEEIRACQAAGLAYEIVPGVTAACASAAELGIGLTQRGVSRSVVFLTPCTEQSRQRTSDHWVDVAMHGDTVVMYMAGNDLQRISQLLINRGRDPNTALAMVESASRDARLWYSTLQAVADGHQRKGADGPVTVILGEVTRAVVAQAAENAQPVGILPARNQLGRYSRMVRR